MHSLSQDTRASGHQIYFVIKGFAPFKPKADIFTARKRSLGQGNVFTRMCHSVHGGGGLCMMSLPVWLPGPMFFLEGLSLVPCTFWGSLSLVPYSFQRGSLVPCSFWGSLSTSYLPDRDPFGQRPFWTETLLDRDPHVR